MKSSSISYHLADTNDLKDTRLLKEQNLKINLTPSELKKGFVNAKYTFVELSQMQKLAPAIIAKYEKLLVGYAFAVSTKFRENTHLKTNYSHISIKSIIATNL